ncbi:MAG: hypothetical protein WC250_03785 [Candidatus Paceibacterota bacterium]|jgi:hypothetical protein
MSEKEIWQYCWDRKVSHSRPLDRDFIWVTKEDFSSVENHFTKDINFLHYGKSQRSRGLFFHLHAVVQDDHVFIHRDNGNLARFLPLGLIHLLLDVVPYVIFSQVKRVPMRLIFARPKTESINETEE